MNNKHKKHIVRITAAILLVCFITYDVTWAYPGGPRFSPDNLATRTLCAYPSEENAFIKMMTGWLGNGGLDKFKDLPVAAAQDFLDEIKGEISSSMPGAFELATRRVGAPNHSAAGQVFFQDGDFVLRCYNPQLKGLIFPKDDFDLIWEQKANRYLHFQVLKLKVGSGKDSDSLQLEEEARGGVKWDREVEAIHQHFGADVDMDRVYRMHKDYVFAETTTKTLVTLGRYFLNGDEKVLDLGSGTGKATFVLSKFSGKVTGVESNPALLKRSEETKEEFSQKKLIDKGKVELTPGDFLDADFDISGFDVVYLYWPYMAEAEEKYDRLIEDKLLSAKGLKPGAIFILNSNGHKDGFRRLKNIEIPYEKSGVPRHIIAYRKFNDTKEKSAQEDEELNGNLKRDLVEINQHFRTAKIKGANQKFEVTPQEHLFAETTKETLIGISQLFLSGEGKKALDLGSGTGKGVAIFSKFADHTTGIELDSRRNSPHLKGDRLFETGRRNIRELAEKDLVDPKKIELIDGSFLDEDFDFSEYDLVYIFWPYMHENAEKYGARLEKKLLDKEKGLKPGAVFVLNPHYYDEGFTRLEKVDIPHEKYGIPDYILAYKRPEDSSPVSPEEEKKAIEESLEKEIANTEENLRKLGLSGRVLIHELNNLLQSYEATIAFADRDVKELRELTNKILNVKDDIFAIVVDLSPEPDKPYDDIKGKWDSRDLEEKQRMALECFEKANELADLIEDLSNKDLSIAFSSLDNITDPANDENLRAIKFTKKMTKLAHLKLTSFIWSKGGVMTSGKKVPVDINKTVELVSTGYAARSINIELSFGDVPHVMGDELLFVEVWLNVIKNAFEAVDRKGTIYISTSLDKATNEVVVEVRDTGRGIATEDMPHVFNMYFTKGKTKGSGIGLPWTKEVIEHHGGTIGLQSEAGVGTTFTIRLPAIKEEGRDKGVSERADFNLKEIKEKFSEALIVKKTFEWKHNREKVEAFVCYDDIFDNFEVYPDDTFKANHMMELGILDMSPNQTFIAPRGSFGMIEVKFLIIDGKPALLFDEIQPSLGYRNIRDKKERNKYRKWAENAIKEMTTIAKSLGVEAFYASNKDRIQERYERQGVSIPEVNLWENYSFPFRGKGWKPAVIDLEDELGALLWQLDTSETSAEKINKYPAGSIYNGYETIINKFKGRNFTFNEFFEERKHETGRSMSRLEVNSLVGLGLLIVNDSEKPYVYRLHEVFEKAPAGFTRGIMDLLWVLPATPKNNQLAQARNEIGKRVLESGLREVVKTVRSSYERRDIEPVISAILLFWPESDFNHAERETIRGSLNLEELRHFERARSLIHRTEIKGGSLNVGDLVNSLVKNGKSKNTTNASKVVIRGRKGQRRQSYQEKVAIQAALEKLPPDLMWIAGIYFGYWDLYEYIVDNPSATKECILELLEKGKEEFFNLLPPLTRTSLEAEYQGMKKWLAGLLMDTPYEDFVFPWFIAALWGEDDQQEEATDVSGEEILGRNRVRVTDMYFRERFSANKISSLVGLNSRYVKAVLKRSASLLAEAFPFAVRAAMLQDGVENIYVMKMGKNAMICRRDKLRKMQDVYEDHVDQTVTRAKESAIFGEREQVKKVEGFLSVMRGMFGRHFYSERRLASIAEVAEMEEEDLLALPEEFLGDIGGDQAVILIDRSDKGMIEMRPVNGVFKGKMRSSLRRNPPSGSIHQGYYTLMNSEDLKGKEFTRLQFQRKRKTTSGEIMSEPTVNSELKGLVALGILEVDKSTRVHKFKLTTKHLRAPPETREAILSILEPLLAKPDDVTLERVKSRIKVEIREGTKDLIFGEILNATYRLRFDIDENEVRARFLEETEKHISKFNIELPEGNRLSTVLRELLFNAFEAVEAKVKEMDAFKQSRYEGEVTFTARINENNLFITIQDNGKGIEFSGTHGFVPPVRHGIMEGPRIPITTKPGEMGGSGLSLARAIIGNSGGAIVLSKRPEGGTRAIVTFPIELIGEESFEEFARAKEEAAPQEAIDPSSDLPEIKREDFEGDVQGYLQEVSDNLIEMNPHLVEAVNYLKRLKEERIISKYYIIGSFAKGYLKAKPRDIDFVVDFTTHYARSEAIGPEVNKITSWFSRLSEKSGQEFHINFFPIGHVFKVEEEDLQFVPIGLVFKPERDIKIVDTDRVFASEVVGKNPLVKYFLIDITGLEPRGDNYFARLYHKIFFKFRSIPSSSQSEESQKKGPEGSIVNGFNRLYDDFREGTFTFKEFMTRRNEKSERQLSETRLRTELMYLRRLGIVEVTEKKGSTLIIQLNREYRNIPLGLLQDIRILLTDLAADPEDDMIKKAQKVLQKKVRKNTLKQLAESFRDLKKVLRSYGHDKRLIRRFYLPGSVTWDLLHVLPEEIEISVVLKNDLKYLRREVRERFLEDENVRSINEASPVKFSINFEPEGRVFAIEGKEVIERSEAFPSKEGNAPAWMLDITDIGSNDHFKDEDFIDRVFAQMVVVNKDFLKEPTNMAKLNIYWDEMWSDYLEMVNTKRKGSNHQRYVTFMGRAKNPRRWIETLIEHRKKLKEVGLEDFQEKFIEEISGLSAEELAEKFLSYISSADAKKIKDLREVDSINRTFASDANKAPIFGDIYINILSAIEFEYYGPRKDLTRPDNVKEAIERLWILQEWVYRHWDSSLKERSYSEMMRSREEETDIAELEIYLKDVWGGYFTPEVEKSGNINNDRCLTLFDESRNPTKWAELVKEEWEKELITEISFLSSDELAEKLLNFHPENQRDRKDLRNIKSVSLKDEGAVNYANLADIYLNILNIVEGAEFFKSIGNPGGIDLKEGMQQLWILREWIYRNWDSSPKERSYNVMVRRENADIAELGAYLKDIWEEYLLTPEEERLRDHDEVEAFIEESSHPEKWNGLLKDKREEAFIKEMSSLGADDLADKFLGHFTEGQRVMKDLRKLKNIETSIEDIGKAPDFADIYRHIILIINAEYFSPMDKEKAVEQLWILREWVYRHWDPSSKERSYNVMARAMGEKTKDADIAERTLRVPRKVKLGEKDLWKIFTEKLKEAGYPEEGIDQIMRAGVFRMFRYEDKYSIVEQSDEVKEIYRQSLSEALGRKIYLTELEEYGAAHEHLHSIIREEEAGRLLRGLREELKEEEFMALRNFFELQQYKFETEAEFVEEIAVSYYSEKLLDNPIRLYDEQNERRIDLDEFNAKIVPLIEMVFGKGEKGRDIKERLENAHENIIISRFKGWREDTPKLEGDISDQRRALLRILSEAKGNTRVSYAPRNFDQIFQKTIADSFSENKEEEKNTLFLFMLSMQFSAKEVAGYLKYAYPTAFKYFINCMDRTGKSEDDSPLSPSDIMGFIGKRTLTVKEQISEDITHLFRNSISVAGLSLRSNFRHLKKQHKEKKVEDFFREYEDFLFAHINDAEQSIKMMHERAKKLTASEIRNFLKDMREIHRKNILEDVEKLNEIINSINIDPDQKKLLFDNNEIIRKTIETMDMYINILEREMSASKKVTIRKIYGILRQVVMSQTFDFNYPRIAWLGGLFPESGSEVNCSVGSRNKITFRVYLGEEFSPKWSEGDRENISFVKENIFARLRIRKLDPETQSFSEVAEVPMEYSGVGGINNHDYNFSGHFDPKKTGIYFVTAEACVKGYKGQEFPKLLWRPSINPNSSEDNPSGDIIFIAKHSEGAQTEEQEASFEDIDSIDSAREETEGITEVKHYIAELKKQGVKTTLAGLDLSKEENPEDIIKHYCVLQDMEAIKKLLKERLQGESKDVFDAIFNTRNRLWKRTDRDGKEPLKIVHVRGGRGAAGITKELAIMAREGLVDLTIIPGAVDDGRSWADMAMHLSATGVPDMGKSASNMGMDQKAVQFVESRLIKEGSYTKEEAFSLLGEVIKGFKGEKYDKDDRNASRLVGAFLKVDLEKQRKILIWTEKFSEIVRLERKRKNIDLDIRIIPMRSILIVGAKETYESWQTAVDEFGSLVESVGKVILPTEKRLHAMAILKDGTFLPSENAINELKKKSDYLFFTVGPQSFAYRLVVLCIFLMSQVLRGPSKEEEKTIERLRSLGRDQLGEEFIKLIETGDKQRVKHIIGLIQHHLSYKAVEAEIHIQPAAIEAVKEADMIVYGPTDIESNIASAVIYEDVSNAIKRNTKSAKVLISNSRDPDSIEPIGTTTLSQLERLYRYLSGQQPYEAEEYDKDKFPVSDHIEYVVGRPMEYENPEVGNYIPFHRSDIREIGAFPVGLDLEMMGMEKNRAEGSFEADYHREDEGKHNSSLVIDTILSLAMLKELGHPIQTLEKESQTPGESSPVDDKAKPVASKGEVVKDGEQESNRQKGIMNSVEKALPHVVNQLLTIDYNANPVDFSKDDLKRAGEEIPEERKRMGIFIDEELGGGRAKEVVEALENLKRGQNKVLAEWLKNVVIISGRIDGTSLEEMEARRHVKKENMMIITRNHEKDPDCLKAYEDTSFITKIDDSDLDAGSYYPLLEVLLFALNHWETNGRAKGMEDLLSDLAVDYYKSIPNGVELTKDQIVDLCWDTKNNKCRNTIIIKIGIPGADEVTAASELYKEIADYIESNA